jgi:hypothetical protein
MVLETEDLGLIARTIRRRTAEVRIGIKPENVLVLGIEEEQPCSLITLDEGGKTFPVSTDELNAFLMNFLIRRGWRKGEEGGLKRDFELGDISEEFSGDRGTCWEDATYTTRYPGIYFVRRSRLTGQSGFPVVSNWRVERERRSLLETAKDVIASRRDV